MNGYASQTPDWYNQAIQQYSNLQNQIQSQIAGVGKSQSQAIKDTYAKEKGDAEQGLTTAGLGNTTVKPSVERGLTLDESKAQTALQNQLAQLSTGWLGQIGSSQIGFQSGYAQQQQQYQQQQNLQAQGYAQQQSQQMQQNPLSGYLRFMTAHSGQQLSPNAYSNYLNGGA